MIIGGGPAAFVLAFTLHRRAYLPATLRATYPTVHTSPGLAGMLACGWASGQRALPEDALQKQFDKQSRPEGDEFKLCDVAGNVLLQQSRTAGLGTLRKHARGPTVASCARSSSPLFPSRR